ncbi:MAG TPA: iron-siderophore ABC transporter substrate-binding protein [Humibacter sp.]|nr:iron-siderophore ABC transporter substrate-binding protein [Humibacter sp.]
MPRRTVLATAAAALTAVALLLTGCSGSTNAEATVGSGGSSSDAAFPVTIKHVYGSTTIESKPKRVATVAWSNGEVPLALGVVPVGMAKATWGDNGDGVYPWVADQLKSLGAKTPALFDETDGIDFEAVANSRPDVILAAYSGLTKEEYQTLSKIAPTIAYPDVAWGTSYEDTILMDSKAIGLEAEGKALITKLHAEVKASLAKYSVLDGKKILFSYIDPKDHSKIGFYTSHDTRPGFLEDLGLPTPTVVKEESKKTDEYYVTVSSEQADRFDDVDLFVTYGDDADAMIKELQADPLLSKIPAIAAGHIAVLKNATPLAASANPSALSIGWGIDDYFALLAKSLG